jgi:hypothetical protein
MNIPAPRPVKVRWAFPVWGALQAVFRVLTDGAAVHPDPPGSMEALQVPADDHWDAAMRHLVAWRRGELVDESGHLALAHAAARVLLLLAREMEVRDGK